METEPGYSEEVRKYLKHPENDSELEAGESEEVRELVAEKNELKAKYDAFLENYELRRIIDENADKLTDEKFAGMIERISRETTIFEEISDTVKADNIINGLDKAQYPTEMEFGVANAKRHGAYNVITGKIEISRTPPSKSKLWRLFALSGMPRIITTMDHEMIHHFFQQARDSKVPPTTTMLKITANYLKMRLGLGLMSRLAPIHLKLEEMGQKNEKWRRLAGFTKNLLEPVVNYTIQRCDQAVAERTSENTISEIVAQKADRIFRPEENTTISLIDTLKTYYGVSDPKEIDKIIVASQWIERFRSVGVSDSTIARIMGQAEYDEKTASFPELKQQMEEMMEKKGTTAEELDTLADVKRLNIEIQNYKAAVIAQGELITAEGIKEIPARHEPRNIGELFAELSLITESMKSTFAELKPDINKKYINETDEQIERCQSLIEEWRKMASDGDVNMQDMESIKKFVKAVEDKIRVFETTSEFI